MNRNIKVQYSNSIGIICTTSEPFKIFKRFMRF